jgi:hypothetical protein
VKNLSIAVVFFCCAMGAAAQTNNRVNDFDKYWNLAVQEAQKAAQIKFGAPPGSDISKGEVRKITTTICRGTISRMLAAHEVATAKKFYDEHNAAGDIDGEESEKLNSEILAALDDEFVAADSEKAIGQSADADGARKAFDHADQTVKDPAMRNRLKSAMWERWLRNRQMANAEYSDALGQATDAWYTNNGDYKKIPQPLWDKLRELDKYQFKHALPGKEVLSTARVAQRQ